MVVTRLHGHEEACALNYFIFRKMALRFSPKQDIVLLREVLVRTPYSVVVVDSAYLWKLVAEGFNEAENQSIDYRRARERTNLLIQYYNAENTAALKRYVDFF
jgi:hypothetical protein